MKLAQNSNKRLGLRGKDEEKRSAPAKPESKRLEWCVLLMEQ